MHCSTHLKKKKDFLFNSLIKIIHISFFYSFFYSKTSHAPAKPLKPLSFFSSSHQALSSLIKLIIPPISLISPHLSSSSNLPSTPKPKLSPSHAVNSHLSASPLPAHLHPCRHRPIFPSNPSSSLAVTAAPPPCSPRRPSPRPSPSPAHFRSVLSLPY